MTTLLFGARFGRTAVRAAAWFGGVVFVCAASVLSPASGADDPVRLGAGSYATALPAGAKAPQATIYRTDAAPPGGMPTNDWWSSLAWLKYSERQYAHPLAVEASAGGLRIFYPGTNISANKAAIFGFMPDRSGDDLVLGSADAAEFPDARVDGYSDWFVRARFGADKGGMTVSYGHGSPFIYATYDSGGAKVTFAAPPKVWSGDEKSPVLGISVGQKHYALFGPAGSTWAGLGGKTITNQPGQKRYFSLAVLPKADEQTLALFKRYAHSHVTDTRVAWQYDAKSGAVTTTFTFTTTAHEGDAKGTLFALYPHQWRHTKTPLLDASYPSVRGTMKLAEGTSFTTQAAFPGVLPALPKVGGDAARTERYLRDDAAKDDPHVRDTYGEGKWLGKESALAAIAEQYGMDAEAKVLRGRVQARLEDWLAAADTAGKPKAKRVFYYDRNWGTLIGYPAGYGSDVELNDHHFHYGYFIRAAAEVARHDPQWAADARWGGMVKLLIRDMASPDRKDPLFPFLRCFDPYAGHSWASGHARFGDGNNQESSSEAMNAWYGMILWGEATGDTATRDLGVYLYTTEMLAINEYWFDVHGENFPKGYTPAVVTMVWGGKGANGTWFSAEPEAVHGINWLPVHAGSLYLGHYPMYVEKNYGAMADERKGTNWKQWSDIIWMYRALSDPDDAMKQFEAAGDAAKIEDGNSRANTYHWIENLKALGQVDPTVTADHPLYAVFRKGDTRTYVAYNGGATPKKVRFSDGFELTADKKGIAVGTRPVGANAK